MHNQISLYENFCEYHGNMLTIKKPCIPVKIEEKNGSKLKYILLSVPKISVFHDFVMLKYDLLNCSYSGKS